MGNLFTLWPVFTREFIDTGICIQQNAYVTYWTQLVGVGWVRRVGGDVGPLL